MKARVAENRSLVVAAEAEVPLALAEAMKSGHLMGQPGGDNAGNGHAG